LKRWVLLSLRPLPWLISLVIHAAFLLAILLVNRSHSLDLSIVTLDLLPAKNIALYVPPKEDLWQKPILRKIKNLFIPKPKVEPTPAPMAAQVGSVEGQGTAQVRSVAEVSQLPRFKTQIKAVYPEAARHSGIEGVVILQVEIDAMGSVMNVEVIQGLGAGCDEAAAAAMRQSTFTPAYAGTEAVPVRIRIPYRFKINE